MSELNTVRADRAGREHHWELYRYNLDIRLAGFGGTAGHHPVAAPFAQQHAVLAEQ